MTTQVYLNAKVINPFDGQKETQNLLLINHRLAGKGYVPDEKEEDIEQIDLKGKIIVPNITDVMTHVRDPGVPEAETLASASQAACAGGVSSLLIAPDSLPVCDTPEMVSHLNQRIKSDAACHMAVLGTITKKAEGKELSELGLMKSQGALGFTDGISLASPVLMKNALMYSSMFDVPLVVKPLSSEMITGGVMHEGYYSTVLGVKGISRTAEETMIARDLSLLREFGGKLHFSHISTQGSVSLLRQAKEEGLDVTCGISIQHLYFTDKDVDGYDTATKVLPPFREASDSNALIQGLKDDVIDMIISGHEPHVIDLKRCDYQEAAFGNASLDIFVPLVLQKLYHEHHFDLMDIVKKISVAPSKRFGLSKRGLCLQEKPSFTVIDCNKEHSVDVSTWQSKSKNTPFQARTLSGWPVMTVVDGKPVFTTLK